MFVPYTMNWDKTQILKKFPSVKIKVIKNALFFLSQAPTHHSFTFHSQFSQELKPMVYFYKTVYRIFHFWFRLDFIKIYFCSTKSMHSLTLKPHNSFHTQNNKKSTHSFATRPLILKLQQKVWKFIDICVSWSSPKTGLETYF